MSDQIELTTGVKDGSKSSAAAYTAGVESFQATADNEEPPKEGIRKTVDAYVTY
jgi:hypothetical protein